MADVKAWATGTCALCGRKMVSDGVDPWHPWDAIDAGDPCPPEDDRLGFFYPTFGKPSKPGLEHFVPLEEAS